MTEVITVRLPEHLLKEIDDLVEKGVFTTRAEAIRAAIRALLERYKTGVKGVLMHE